MIILFLNCGSSSVKYSVYDWDQKKSLCAGGVERIGIEGAFITHDRPGKLSVEIKRPLANHKDAINLVIQTITNKEHGVIEDINVISAVGHRIVHGGKFAKSVIVDDSVVDELRNIADLAPLHNYAHIMGIEAARALLPNVTHVCVMDTAFHQTMPAAAFMYALPRKWYTDYRIRRYGFHGSSVLYTSRRAAVLMDKEVDEINTIVCHIGAGASVTAVKNGQCIDTSMGLTPLEGLVMGSRSGDIDPSACFYMMQKLNMKPEEMYTILNKKSGMYALTGDRFSDQRDVRKGINEGDELCKLAVDVQAHRIRKYIGAYMLELGRLDSIVFTAGIGERAPDVRARVLKGLENFGIVIDPERNEAANTNKAECRISADNSRVKVFVIPTDEEIVGVQDIVALLAGTYDVYTKFRYIFQEKDYRNKLRDAAFIEDVKKHPSLLKAAVNLPEALKQEVKK
ncbi:MAG: acetate kinase [Elusimicrobiaceae bacterium]|nr:acetate kinase [Elusimicrobiaceae bacterium]